MERGWRVPFARNTKISETRCLGSTILTFLLAAGNTSIKLNRMLRSIALRQYHISHL